MKAAAYNTCKYHRKIFENFHFPKYSNQSSADKIRKTGSFWENITCYLAELVNILPDLQYKL